jgi:transcriptional regulator GlxA family with amidase domain
MTSFSAKPVRYVVFIVFPDVKLLDLSGALQVFEDANSVCSANYKTAILALQAGPVKTDTAVTISADAISKWPGLAIDTLIVTGGPGTRAASTNNGLIADVKHLAAASTRVASICTGAFVLAATGLLDHRRCVTHWESCAHLQNQFPQVNVDPDPIYVRDDNVWTSAGVTAGIDMALAMVAQDHGRQAALALARSLVAYMMRPGGQSQFSPVLDQQTSDAGGRFEALHTWIIDNLANDLRVEKLAEQANMSARNFARVYAAETGSSPARAVERFRVEAARRLLEDTDLSVTAIANRCGFNDDERLRRAMTRAVALSPNDYRKHFGAGSKAAG